MLEMAVNMGPERIPMHIATAMNASLQGANSKKISFINSYKYILLSHNIVEDWGCSWGGHYKSRSQYARKTSHFIQHTIAPNIYTSSLRLISLIPAQCMSVKVARTMFNNCKGKGAAVGGGEGLFEQLFDGHVLL